MGVPPIRSIGPDVIGHLPRYQLIRQVLRQKILSGELVPGAQLPPEVKLAAQYGVSRVTAIQALNALAAEGLVTRQQGRGTFVAERPHQPVRVAAITGFLEDLVRQARDVSTQQVSRQQVSTPRDIAERLELEEGSPIVLISRVRLIEGSPLTFVMNYIRPEWARYLTEAHLQSRLTVLELLEREARVVIDYARQTIHATNADASRARLLEVPIGSALLEMRRTDISKRHGPIQHVISSYRADRYVYSVDLIRQSERGQRFWKHGAGQRLGPRQPG